MCGKFVRHIWILSKIHNLSYTKKCYFTDHTWITEDPAESRRVSLASTKLTDVMSRLRWQKCTNVIVACSKFKQAGQGNVK